MAAHQHIGPRHMAAANWHRLDDSVTVGSASVAPQFTSRVDADGLVKLIGWFAAQWLPTYGSREDKPPNGQ